MCASQQINDGKDKMMRMIKGYMNFHLSLLQKYLSRFSPVHVAVREAVSENILF